MAREQEQSIYKEMFRLNQYKPTLGKYTRRATSIAIAVVAILGAWSFSTSLGLNIKESLDAAMLREGNSGNYNTMLNASKYLATMVFPLFFAGLGSWFAYRIAQYPPFADFLISVEGELAKVTWPDKTHLIRGTIVVLCTMVILTTAMFVYDVVWQFVFQKIGFLTF